MDDWKSVSSCTLERLNALAQELGQPAYRAGQLYGWLHKKNAVSYDEMTNLPAAFCQKLAKAGWEIDAPKPVRVQKSADGTEKLLLALRDGNCVETVLMRYHHGLSVCISSQVGCRMGCGFCATTHCETPGLVRNLTAGEMAGEVYAAARHAGERIANIVLMGIGEPLDNFDSVMDFVTIITSAEGYGLSGRSISLSTCGVVPGIRALAEHRLPLTLSVSLHAANDAARSRMMPVNGRWPLAVLMEACREYRRDTGRRVSFEYAMVRGQNDSPKDARDLAALLQGLDAHVNLIPTNPVDGSPFTASDNENIEAFAQRLKKLGVQTTVRRRLGADIDAACGQLRNRHEDGGGGHGGQTQQQ